MSIFTPGPYTACTGEHPSLKSKKGERCYFPHIHLGPAEHGRKYISSDGTEHEARARAITINEGGNKSASALEECDATAKLLAASWDLLQVVQEVATRMRYDYDFTADECECSAWRRLQDCEHVDVARVLRKAGVE